MLGSSPWDTDFVLPPSMAASGRVRPPPELETEVTKEQAEESKSEEQMADENNKESLRSLEQQSTDVSHPQLERVRSPRRTNEDELSDDDPREHKRQTVAQTLELQKFTIGAIFATLSNIRSSVDKTVVNFNDRLSVNLTFRVVLTTFSLHTVFTPRSIW